MNWFRIDGKAGGYPTPETVDILAEIQEWRTGKNLKGRSGTLRSLLASVLATDKRHPDHREALIALAAHIVARVERIDRKPKR